MKIYGIEGMSGDQISFELQRGGRFVVFQYAVSAIIVSFRRASNIHFVRAGESTVPKSIGFTVLSLVAGWWGIPWGPIYTIRSVTTNLRGGKDVTQQVVAALNTPALRNAAPAPN
ncbi:MAG TPA: hypothetical protein VJO53_15035 [Candidatus Acidoferrales bacterium]|nr:hypothetical protein [Candidatus Acidoferrales bacterium]